MVKLNRPLLSLDAHGTIGDSLTFQSNSKRKFVREKPRLPYSLTLPQQYQRWLYQDYADLWTRQSEVTKRAYAADGVRFHLTGFQYWMKYNLANLPDILGWWRLDSLSGSIVKDSSRYDQDGTVFGCVDAPGQVYRGLYFDGINDYVNLGQPPQLAFDPTADYTFLMWVKLFAPGVPYEFAEKRLGAAGYLWARDVPTGMHVFGAAWHSFTIGATVLPSLTWLRLAVVFSNQSCQLYLNGLPDGPPVAGLAFQAVTAKDVILGRPGGFGWLKGWEDDFRLYNRCFTPAELIRDAGRSWKGD